MEPSKSPTPLTTQENKQQDTPSSLKDPTIPILMFLGVIVATLSVIVAGYFHGNMHLITTLKNAANPQSYSIVLCVLLLENRFAHL